MKRENTPFYIWQAALVLPLTGYMWSGTRPVLSCSDTAASSLFLFLMTAALGLLMVTTGRADWVFWDAESLVQKENFAAQSEKEASPETGAVPETEASPVPGTGTVPEAGAVSGAVPETEASPVPGTGAVPETGTEQETRIQTGGEASAVPGIAAPGRRSGLLQLLAFALAAVLYLCYVFPLDGWVDAVRPAWISSKILDSLTAGGMFCIAALLSVRRRLS